MCYIAVAQLVHLSWYAWLHYPFHRNVLSQYTHSAWNSNCTLPISSQISKQANDLAVDAQVVPISSSLSASHITQGPVSAYFTVFAAPYLPIHTTKIEKADEVYARNIGTHLLKVMLDSIGCKKQECSN